jgi:hypothetical protein
MVRMYPLVFSGGQAIAPTTDRSLRSSGFAERCPLTAVRKMGVKTGLLDPLLVVGLRIAGERYDTRRAQCIQGDDGRTAWVVDNAKFSFKESSGTT